MEKLTASQEETRNTFPAQPNRKLRGQYPGSTSGGPQQEQAKAVTVLRSGQIIGTDVPPLIPLEVKDDGDDVVSLTKKDQSEEKVDDTKDEEGEKYKTEMMTP